MIRRSSYSATIKYSRVGVGLNIPYPLSVWVTFHLDLLLSAIAGFRPGVIIELKYSQVCLAVIYNPVCKKVILVAIITIYQNKRREKVILKAQDKT